MDTSNMVFAVAYKNSQIISALMQIDNGEAFKKEYMHKFNIRFWDIAGCEHYHDINETTQQEIKDFMSSLSGGK